MCSSYFSIVQDQLPASITGQVSRCRMKVLKSVYRWYIMMVYNDPMLALRRNMKDFPYPIYPTLEACCAFWQPFDHVSVQKAPKGPGHPALCALSFDIHWKMDTGVACFGFLGVMNPESQKCGLRNNPVLSPKVHRHLLSFLVFDFISNMTTCKNMIFTHGSFPKWGNSQNG